MKGLIEKLKFHLKTKEIIEDDYLSKELEERILFLTDSEIFKEHVLVDSMLDDQKLVKNSKVFKDFLLLGDRFYAKRDFSHAIKMYNKSLLFGSLDEPNLYTIYVKRSQCLAKKKMLAAAAEDLEKAVEHGCPEEKQFLFYEKIVKCYSVLGDKEKVS